MYTLTKQEYAIFFNDIRFLGKKVNLESPVTENKKENNKPKQILDEDNDPLKKTVNDTYKFVKQLSKQIEELRCELKNDKLIKQLQHKQNLVL